MFIELTEQQINNLIIFLNRVEIKGLHEVTAFNEIIDILFKGEKGIQIKDESKE